ncbi:MAG: histidine phosphatase family protein [Alphaproteobacteria bacterium]|nr:histidine phosphatase family protein [Alphaproteobacteria bacterium]
MTLLIIARHGNTFGPEDTPTRVGARTDLPLVESGRDQAKKLGCYLKDHNFVPEVTYSSQLKRTIETAEIALKQTNFPQPVFPLNIFNEIDYGPDENQTEDNVIARIGAQAIKEWDEKAIVPEGWQFNPDECIQNWKNFAEQILLDCHPEQSEGSHYLTQDSSASLQNDNIVLVVTSNGIARFAPHITDHFDSFADNNKIKLSTGALGILEFSQNKWIVKDWNIKP